jgi:hypothetical protein
MSNRKRFHLSAEEAEYVSKLALEDSSFRNAFPKRSEYCEVREPLSLDHAEAEVLRSYFTERLARVGLDENYEPNQEGVMLEGLIDRLYLTAEEWSAE